MHHVPEVFIKQIPKSSFPLSNISVYIKNQSSSKNRLNTLLYRRTSFIDFKLFLKIYIIIFILKKFITVTISMNSINITLSLGTKISNINPAIDIPQAINHKINPKLKSSSFKIFGNFTSKLS